MLIVAAPIVCVLVPCFNVVLSDQFSLASILKHLVGEESAECFNLKYIVVVVQVSVFVCVL